MYPYLSYFYFFEYLFLMQQFILEIYFLSYIRLRAKNLTGRFSIALLSGNCSWRKWWITRKRKKKNDHSVESVLKETNFIAVERDPEIENIARTYNEIRHI